MTRIIKNVWPKKKNIPNLQIAWVISIAEIIFNPNNENIKIFEEIIKPVLLKNLNKIENNESFEYESDSPERLEVAPKRLAAPKKSAVPERPAAPRSNKRITEIETSRKEKKKIRSIRKDDENDDDDDEADEGDKAYEAYETDEGDEYYNEIINIDETEKIIIPRETTLTIPAAATIATTPITPTTSIMPIVLIELEKYEVAEASLRKKQKIVARTIKNYYSNNKRIYLDKSYLKSVVAGCVKLEFYEYFKNWDNKYWNSYYANILKILLRGSIANRMRSTLFAIFEKHKLSYIDTKSTLQEIKEWKDLKQLKNMYEKLYQHIDNNKEIT
ncbi:hypothetical protein Glove_27g2 [Diversispora epigaea]|uniref:Uncharacterized protein n=1 Tax=Diversispora epigaea TaxID=1348612 RepID=A0A397JMD2_9GLOM|nr:hypothetical protein Glove_27g2 [Diversispora epigaea]